MHADPVRVTAGRLPISHHALGRHALDHPPRLRILQATLQEAIRHHADPAVADSSGAECRGSHSGGIVVLLLLVLRVKLPDGSFV